MIEKLHPSTFNSSLETGVRSLAILVAGHPSEFDLQRLVELDYLVVHSADVGGPESLHAPLPLRAGELLVRRELIENGLLLMMSRGLVLQLTRASGIVYLASESAAPFLSMLAKPYTLNLRDRANWAIGQFANKSTSEIRAVTQGVFEKWTSDFQAIDYPGNANEP